MNKIDIADLLDSIEKAGESAENSVINYENYFIEIAESIKYLDTQLGEINYHLEKQSEYLQSIAVSLEGILTKK